MYEEINQSVLMVRYAGCGILSIVFLINIYQVWLEGKFRVQPGALIKQYHRGIAIASLLYIISRAVPYTYNNKPAQLVSDVALDATTVVIYGLVMLTCFQMTKNVHISTKMSLSKDQEHSLWKFYAFLFLFVVLSFFIQWAVILGVNNNSYAFIYIGTIVIVLAISLYYIWRSFLELNSKLTHVRENLSRSSNNSNTKSDDSLDSFRNFMYAATLILVLVIVYQIYRLYGYIVTLSNNTYWDRDLNYINFFDFLVMAGFSVVSYYSWRSSDEDNESDTKSKTEDSLTSSGSKRFNRSNTKGSTALAGLKSSGNSNNTNIQLPDALSIKSTSPKHSDSLRPSLQRIGTVDAANFVAPLTDDTPVAFSNSPGMGPVAKEFKENFV